jgi:hypothetical protein
VSRLVHATHRLEQVGPCVYCADCNVRLYQGRVSQAQLALREIQGVLDDIKAHEEAVARCRHTILVELLQVDGSRWRRCLLCGHAYDLAHWHRLEQVIRERYRLPPSPWSAEERSQDSD